MYDHPPNPNPTPPPPPWNFQLGLAPLERLPPSNTLLHYTIMRKMIVPTIKRKKILLFMLTQHLIISILPCKDLSQLMINSKAPRNMDAITYTTQMMPSKEPVRFKLNTEARVGFLYLSFLEPNDITVNTTMYCVIQQQLNNRKFIHGSMITIYHVSCGKSTQAIELTVFEKLLTVK